MDTYPIPADVQVTQADRDAAADVLLERIDRLELALEPLSIMFGAANMNEPISAWLNMAHLAAARAALSQEQSNDRT